MSAVMHVLAGMHAGLLHTILFNRALGMVVPRDVESELLDITYVSAHGYRMLEQVCDMLEQLEQ